MHGVQAQQPCDHRLPFCAYVLAIHVRNSCDQVPFALRRAASDLCAIAQEFVDRDDDDDGEIPIARLRDAGHSLSQRMKAAGKKIAKGLPGAEATMATPQKVLVGSHLFRMRFATNSVSGCRWVCWWVWWRWWS